MLYHSEKTFFSKLSKEKIATFLLHCKPKLIFHFGDKIQYFLREYWGEPASPQSSEKRRPQRMLDEGILKI